MMSTTAPQPATTPIPVQLSEPEFTAFILPHLSMPKRGPKCKLGYYRVVNAPGAPPPLTIDIRPTRAYISARPAGRKLTSGAASAFRAPVAVNLLTHAKEHGP